MIEADSIFSSAHFWTLVCIEERNIGSYQDSAIGWDTISRADDDEVTDSQLGDRDEAFFSISDDLTGLGNQVVKALYSLNNHS